MVFFNPVLYSTRGLLTGVNLSVADLTGADIFNTNLFQLFYDEEAIFPPDFDPAQYI